jgi:hypothetical protein
VARILARRPRGNRGWIGLDGARPASGARRRGLVALAVVMGIGVVVPVVADALGLSPLVSILVLLALVATWVGLKSVLGLASAPTVQRIGLAIHTPPPARRSPEARRVRGRVRLLEPVIAPLSGERVAAFRLMGNAWGGQVDDSGGGIIEVDPDDGSAPIRIDLSAATIALDVEESEDVVSLSAELGRFLEERWLYPEKGPVRIAEATLGDGDPIELDAVVSSETTPEGYRETRVAQVAEDRADTGAIVRRPRT